MLQKIIKGRFRKLSIISMLCAIIGISLLLFSIQLHSDWTQINQGSEDYVVINKPVNILSTLGFSAGFAADEIKEVSEQPFINHVGIYQSNDFGVSLGSNRLGFSTEAFFESVPDEFVDIEHPRWSHYEEGEEIPIILSADYLALYNFGFAPSQGLPQFTANTINKVALDVQLRGRNGIGQFKGRIVGFSKRLNSIIVPQSFLEFANKKYGGTQSKLPSRLILKVDNPKAAALISYTEENGYELNSNKAFGEETAMLITRSILLISFIGILVLMLTLLVFYLSYKLIIEERIHDIRILFTQGYQPKSIASHFIKYTGLLLGISLVVAVFMTQLSHFYIAYELQQIGYEIKGVLSLKTWTFSIILAISLLLGSRFIILNTIRSKYE